ncbi:glycosyl transferase family 2 [Methanocaldococcus infernus ME]|uniref:Glycosyl transferase family 2 n=1 Tax=Methanocaldococcus infernus (strain DSM 11812 / JCM 15783 / ME) TaxID=573063 RepID=D5VU57_METIM|nr:glycosyltransferase [Methanocaldococcus infernus]ADG14110.1 glycosyl transferase family 2 [Methanocaldococcus infernus ME]
MNKIKKPEIKEVYDPYVKNNKKRKKVAIVMPTYNQYEATRKNIIFLKKQSLVPDIIIVDNNSKDNTFERLKKEFPNIILIKLKDNYGGAGGFYIGQKYAYEKGYEYIILNDNDAYPIDEDLIESLVKESNKNTITQPFNVDEDFKEKNNFWFFHYVCFKRHIIKKLGFVDYKFFLYGDEVEYYLRIKKYKTKIKKIYKKYSHPIKYYYSPNREYFATRNEIYLENVYRERKSEYFGSLLTKFVYLKIYEPNKYKVTKRAIKDLLNKKWDNPFIRNNINNDIKYLNMKREVFLNTLPKQGVVFLEKPKIIKLLKDLSNKIKYSKLSFLKGKVLVTYAPTINMFLFNRVFYIIDFNEEKDIVTFFEINNKPIDKLKFLFYTIYFFIYLNLILFLTKKNCNFFKKVNEGDLKCKN